jgi:hypothetical protein
VFLQKTNFNIEKFSGKLSIPFWGFVFVVSALTKTVLAFQNQSTLWNILPFVLVVLHKTTIVAGLITCWYASDKIVGWFMNKAWFVWLSAFSFIIYALHAPLITLIIDSYMQAICLGKFTHLFAFFTLPLLVSALSIVVGSILRLILPRFYGLLTD